MKIRLNLATSPLENNRRFIFSAAMVGTLAVTALLLLGRHAYGDWRASRELRAEISRLESEIRGFREQRRDLEEFFKTPETRKVMDRAAFLNTLIEQRSFPWTKVFMDLERVLPEGVRVVSIAPRMENGRVEMKLTIGAVSDEAKVKFLKTLEESPEFTGLQLRAETRPSRPEQSDRVQLELVTWYEAGAR